MRAFANPLFTAAVMASLASFGLIAASADQDANSARLAQPSQDRDAGRVRIFALDIAAMEVDRVASLIEDIEQVRAEHQGFDARPVDGQLVIAGDRPAMRAAFTAWGGRQGRGFGQRGRRTPGREGNADSAVRTAAYDLQPLPWAGERADASHQLADRIAARLPGVDSARRANVLIARCDQATHDQISSIIESERFRNWQRPGGIEQQQSVHTDVYDVRDLIGSHDDRDRRVAMLIAHMREVSNAAWQANNDTSDRIMPVQSLNGNVIVTCAQPVHDVIAGELNRMRRVAGRPMVIEQRLAELEQQMEQLREELDRARSAVVAQRRQFEPPRR